MFSDVVTMSRPPEKRPQIHRPDRVSIPESDGIGRAGRQDEVEGEPGGDVIQHFGANGLAS